MILALALAGALAGHPGPPIWLELLVRDDALQLDVHGEPVPLALCLGIEGDLVGPHAPEEAARLEQALRRALADEPRVTVDGEPRAARFERVAFPEDTPDRSGWLVVDVSLAIPLRAPPREVSLVWQRYDGAIWSGETFVPVTVRHGRLPEVFSVWPAEPELVWHAPRASLADAPAAPAIPAAPVPSAPRVRLPIASLGLLAAGGAALFLLRRRRAALRWTAALGASALAVAARGAWLFPLCALPPPRPSADEARAIFARLHASLYAAFDATGEDAIYDRLARCVAPALVDALYGEVRESLVLREQGGAVCAIEGVDLRSCEVSFERPGPGFEADAAWEVRGLVSHWGHLHRRRNAYRARWSVEPLPEAPGADGGRVAWKIARIDVRQHERVDE